MKYILLTTVKARVPYNTSENKLRISPVPVTFKFGSDISHKYNFNSFEGYETN